MKFTITREQLLTPLQQIVSVIEKRQTMPILSNVKLVVNDNVLTLTGTDLELQQVANINLETAESGAITVPAKKFLDLIRLSPSEALITIETADDDKILVKSGRSRFSLSTLPAENYPEFSEDKLPNQFFINAGKLKKALSKTMFCMANNDVRYYLNGLMLNINNDTLKIVASDGHRLSIYTDKLDTETGYEERIIIPRKGVIELAKLLDDADAELNVEFSANNIRVSIKDTVFSAKLIDAKYPDFSKVFSQDFMSELIADRQGLKDTLTRVAVLSNEKFKGVSFDVSENLIKLSSHNPEHDEGEEEIEVEFSDNPLLIAFNANYLLDAIGNLDGEKVALIFASNALSCFIQETALDSNYKYIVMPVRL